MASTFPELFAAAVTVYGDRTAVVHGDRSLTYRELDARANRLARRLIGHGVGPDVLVGVSVPRSTDLVVTVLGVLKAGGAYLPLDPSYPSERLRHMLADARPQVIIGDPGDPGDPALDAIARIDPADTFADPGGEITDAERLRPLEPRHLLYVIFTSGSSGPPKGVAVTHEGLADMLTTQALRVGIAPGERVLQWASISFDAAFWDLSLALLAGGVLVVADADDVLPGDPLRQTLLQHEITHVVLPPAALSVTCPEGLLAGGTIMSTGEACTPALVSAWSAEGRRMFNGYGPTEVTVGATIAGPITEAGTEVGIGRPWTGGHVRVLDNRMQRVPNGSEGEIFLAGSGLARGYLNRPGLTATRFLPDPFGRPGSRMYRTGDRGRIGADGQLYFTGRTDNQVKINGCRVELGEIETCLVSFPEVALAAAMVSGTLADALVVAFVSAAPGATLEPAVIRRRAAERLAPFMVPARVVVVDRFPTTANGKIDRSALLKTEVEPAVEPEPAAGSADDESFVMATVGRLLQIDGVEADDNLFDLGANSVVAARLVSALRETYGIRLPVRAVYKAADLRELAATVRERRGVLPAAPTSS